MGRKSTFSLRDDNHVPFSCSVPGIRAGYHNPASKQIWNPQNASRPLLAFGSSSRLCPVSTYSHVQSSKACGSCGLGWQAGTDGASDPTADAPHPRCFSPTNSLMPEA
jgi:hypothetical protein